MIRYPAVRSRLGRCPDCGVAVKVQPVKGRPALTSPHGCPVRLCVYPGCDKKDAIDRMAERPAGEWYCPVHGLLLAAKDLVALHRADGDVRIAISELVAKVLPEHIAKIERPEPTGQ